AVYHQVSRATNPLYLVLHQSLYPHPGAQPTDWTAQRVLPDYPEFKPKKSDTPYLPVEMFFVSYIDLDQYLLPIVLATEMIAEYSKWGPLYDVDQLGRNTVPVAALVYTDDVFVERNLSMASAEQVANLQVWESDQWHHDGISEAGAEIFRGLHSMLGAD